MVVADDHRNSSPEALARIEEIAGRPLAASYRLDVRDRAGLDEVFRAHRFDAVVHFAALKNVRESWDIPFEYYDVNLGALLAVLDAMREHGVERLSFLVLDLRRGAGRAAGREQAGAAHEPLRALQVDVRADPRRRVPHLAGARDVLAALLQPGRRAPVRPPRRGPDGHPRAT